KDKIEPIMTKNVITVTPDDPIDLAARKLEQYNISALPVIDKEHRVVGIITSEDLSKLFARRGRI
ncbi:MAG: CBS domain-containing protein, partial [Methanocellales archaeon]